MWKQFLHQRDAVGGTFSFSHQSLCHSMNYFVKVVKLNIWISHLDYLEKEKKLSRSCHGLLRKWLWAVKLNIISAARTHVREASAHRFRWIFTFPKRRGSGSLSIQKIYLQQICLCFGGFFGFLEKNCKIISKKDFTLNRQNRPNL